MKEFLMILGIMVFMVVFFVFKGKRILAEVRQNRLKMRETEVKLDQFASNQLKTLEYLKVAHGLSVEHFCAPVTAEINRLEQESAKSRKRLKPLKEAMIAAEQRLADLTKVKLTANPTEDQLDAEAAAYVATLKLKTARERLTAQSDYLDNRSERMQQYADQKDVAKLELDEAKQAFEKFETMLSAGDFEQKIKVLRDQLATFREAEKLISSISIPVQPSCPPSDD